VLSRSGQRPVAAREKAADEVGEDVIWVSGGAEDFWEKRDDDFEGGEDEPMLEEFPGTGICVTLSEADKSLGAEDDGQEKGKAEHVIEVAMSKPTADMLGFEEESIERVEGKRRDTNGVGKVAEISRGHSVCLNGHWHRPIGIEQRQRRR